MDIKYFFLFLIIVAFIRCTPPETQQMENKSFFDLNSFLEKETKRLSESKTALTKTVTLNGIIEKKEINNADYHIELLEFFSSDINKTAWLDKYEEKKSNDLISYTCLDENLEVKNLTIELNNNIPKKINIKKSTENFLNGSNKELIYNPNDGYSIKSIRKSIGQDYDTLLIIGEFRIR